MFSTNIPKIPKLKKKTSDGIISGLIILLCGVGLGFIALREDVIESKRGDFYAIALLFVVIAVSMGIGVGKSETPVLSSLLRVVFASSLMLLATIFLGSSVKATQNCLPFGIGLLLATVFAVKEICAFLKSPQG